jgi:hypothetical protein
MLNSICELQLYEHIIMIVFKIKIKIMPRQFVNDIIC